MRTEIELSLSMSQLCGSREVSDRFFGVFTDAESLIEQPTYSQHLPLLATDR